jgi:hypothetical protein
MSQFSEAPSQDVWEIRDSVEGIIRQVWPSEGSSGAAAASAPPLRCLQPSRDGGTLCPSQAAIVCGAGGRHTCVSAAPEASAAGDCHVCAARRDAHPVSPGTAGQQPKAVCVGQLVPSLARPCGPHQLSVTHRFEHSVGTAKKAYRVARYIYKTQGGHVDGGDGAGGVDMEVTPSRATATAQLGAV